MSHYLPIAGKREEQSETAKRLTDVKGAPSLNTARRSSKLECTSFAGREQSEEAKASREKEIYPLPGTPRSTRYRRSQINKSPVAEHYSDADAESTAAGKRARAGEGGRPRALPPAGRRPAELPHGSTAPLGSRTTT